MTEVIDNREVFYSRSKHTIIDFLRSNGKTLTFGRTLSDIQKRFPDAELTTVHTACEHKYNSLISKPIQISNKKFEEMLSVLPPVKWKVTANTESFMMGEALCGPIVNIYCRIGSKYFQFSNYSSLTHEHIVKTCKEVIENEKPNSR